MRRAKRIAALILAAAVAAGLFAAVPAQAKKKKAFYWQNCKQIQYVYEEGKWVKEYQYVENYKKNEIVSWKNITYRQWDDDQEKMVNKKQEDEMVYSKNYSAYYENGKLVSKTKDTTDKKGRITVSKTYNAKGKRISTEKIKYDKKGNVASEKTTYKSKKKKTEEWKHSYTYYSGKKILKKQKSVYSVGGEVKTTYTTYYDKKGRMTKHVWKDSDGYKSTEYYDTKGRLKKDVTEAEYYNSTTTYTYDKKNRKIKSVEKWENQWEDGKESGKTVRTYSYKTDKNGNITEEIEKLDGEFFTKIVYKNWKKIWYYK